jgi:hypothetical protein
MTSMAESEFLVAAVPMCRSVVEAAGASDTQGLLATLRKAAHDLLAVARRIFGDARVNACQAAIVNLVTHEVLQRADTLIDEMDLSDHRPVVQTLMRRAMHRAVDARLPGIVADALNL